MCSRQMHWTSGACKGSSAFDCITLSEMLMSVAWLNSFPLLCSLSLFDHVASMDGIGKADANRILLEPPQETSSPE